IDSIVGGGDLNLNLINKLESVELTYDAANEELAFSSSLPAGFTATISPSPLTGIESGRNNELKYQITVSDGVNSQTYEISQSFSGRPETGDKCSLSFNKNCVADNRNALKLADLQSK